VSKDLHGIFLVGADLPALKTASMPIWLGAQKVGIKSDGVFDVHGAEDGGNDPERFEAGLILRRMRRVAAQAELAAELQVFARLLADDALHTGETVLIAAQHALDTARSIGESNVKYGPFLTTTFEALRGMTKAALAEGAKLRAERAARKAQAEAEAAAQEKAQEKATAAFGAEKAR